MRKFGKLILFLLIVIGVMAVLSTAMNDTWKVKRSIEVSASPASVYAVIANPSTWPSWTVWNTRENPSLEFKYDGATEGRGAKSYFQDNKSKGSMVIGECIPPGRNNTATMAYTFTMDGFPPSQGRFTLNKPVKRTEVVWELQGKHEGSFIEKAVSKWMMIIMKQQIGKDFDASLKGLQEKVDG